MEAKPSPPESTARTALASGHQDSASSSSPSPDDPAERSYAQILKSSSLIGGSAAVNILIKMGSVKACAMFLGPEGYGLFKLYQTVFGMITGFSSLGIGFSGVREIADAVGSGDSSRIGIMVQVLRKMCWITGLFGLAATIALAWPLSQWVFHDTSQAPALAILGFSILIFSIAGGQAALIQGMRKITMLAQMNILSATATGIVTVFSFWALGQNGIVPAIGGGALAGLLISWLYARKVLVPSAQNISWPDAVRRSKRLVLLGLAVMWAGLLGSIVATFSSSLIVRQFNMEANGYFAAASGLSGLFAGFILNAMGTDFCPRITAVHTNHPLVCRLVNEQTEVGLLLALPGMVGTMFFAPWAIKIFYTPEFMVAASLLPWMVMAVFGRVLSWPMGYVLIAKGESRLFSITETAWNGIYLGLFFVGLKFFGLTGAAISGCILYIIVTAGMVLIARRLIGYKWSRSVWKLTALILFVLLAGLLAPMLLDQWSSTAIGIILSLSSALLSLRGIAHRLGTEHRLVQKAMCIPGFRSIINFNLSKSQNLF